MPEYTVNIERLPEVLAQGEQRRQRRILTGLKLGAERARVEAIRATPVDQGEARRAWEVKTLGTDEVQLRNDTVHAEVLELGRRPGRTPPPLGPILEWVYRHADELGVGNARSDLVTRKTIGTGYSIIKGRHKRREFWKVEDVEADATHVARAIQGKIGRDGSEPQHIIASRLPMFGRWVEEEVRQLLEAE